MQDAFFLAHAKKDDVLPEEPTFCEHIDLEIKAADGSVIAPDGYCDNCGEYIGVLEEPEIPDVCEPDYIY